MVNISQDEWQDIIDIYEKVGNDLLFSIINRLTKNMGLGTTEWKLKKLKEMGKLNKESIKKIASAGKQATKLLNNVIDKVALKAIKEQGIDGNITSSVLVAINSMKAQAQQSFNLVNTVMQAGFTDNCNKYFVALESARNQALNQGITEAVIGTDAINSIISKTIHNMSEMGICEFIDKAGRHWSADSYVSMDIRTTLNNTAHEVIDAQARDYGEKVILVSSHPGARPKCAPYQGRCYSMDGTSGVIKDANGNEYEYEPIENTSYGEPDGLFGINCKHTYRYVVEGRFISREQKIETQEQAEANKKRYILTQKQRQQERNIRIKEREYKALESYQKGSGNDLKIKIRDLKNSYNTFCKTNGLRYRSDRLKLLF